MGWALLDALARTVCLVALAAGVAVLVVAVRVELDAWTDRDTRSHDGR